MQEIYVRRELSSQHVEISSVILNLYHGYKIPVNLKSDNRVNYRQVLKEIVRCIETGARYPVPNQDSCSRCVFSHICEWSSKR